MNRIGAAKCDSTSHHARLAFTRSFTRWRSWTPSCCARRRYLSSGPPSRARDGYRSHRGTLSGSAANVSSSISSSNHRGAAAHGSRPRFVRNRAGAIPLNNWLVIEPLNGVDPDVLFAALKEASEAALRSDAREYGNGLWKLEPSELKRLPLPGF